MEAHVTDEGSNSVLSTMVTEIVNHLKADGGQTVMNEKWRFVAAVIDRLALICYLVAIAFLIK